MLRLDKQQISKLKQSLTFLHVDELRDLCNKMYLPSLGKKLNLINRILHFSSTGNIINEPQIPSISLAPKHALIQLKKDSLILKGHYKNDLKTRLFFKSIIGEHFHFTAFGIDWINQRWLDSNPPTYEEFAKMWQLEYQRRKQFGSTPKEEWAYINFNQQIIKKHPLISRIEMNNMWEIERQRHKKLVIDLLIDFIK